MCGIAGWVSFDRNLEGEHATVKQMTGTMCLRGPDAHGMWFSRHAALGHHRLAVIDLEGGAQPMVAGLSEAAVAITYSGEVYNYRELREELWRKGHRFTTSSDTEVVLRGFLEWGDGVAEKLNGMYAFAIWDSRRQQLTMIRDRLGIKPLYYCRTADGVLFGSEPKALLANRLVRRTVDLAGLRRLAAYVMTLPSSVWADLHEVAPGSIINVSRDGLARRVYWKLTPREHEDDTQTTVATVRELLVDSVRRQLVADVPCGLLLSGGLDSSTLAALAVSGALDGRMQTFSIDFVGRTETFKPDDERADPDGPYVREIVAFLGTNHRAVVFDSAALVNQELRRAVVSAYDLPPGSGDRDRSMYLLFEAIRQNVTVALSGEAADELFGGYKWFHDPGVQQAPMFPWITACLPTYGLSPGALAPELETAMDMNAYLVDEYQSALGEVEQLDHADHQERRMRAICYLHLTRQLRVLLDRKDRLSMAVGLEVRVPYCDHRLVEYVYNAPWALKTFDGREKSLLRAAAAHLLPASILHRVKTAYPSIQGGAFVAALQEEARELLSSNNRQVFDLVRRSWLSDAVRVSPELITARMRNSLEWILNLAAWLELARPELRLR